MIKVRILVIVCFMMTGILNPYMPVFAQETITFAFFDKPEQSTAFKLAEMVYTEAFRRLDLQFRYIVIPPKRAILSFNTGEIDGEPARIGSYAEEHPNLIRVEEPVFIDKVLAIVANPSIHIENWESMRGSKYRVEYYRGIAIAEKHLMGLVDADSLTTISHPIQAFKKLNAQRIDVYVDTSSRMMFLLQSPEFKKFNLRIAAVLDEVRNYPYLHKRKADLAPRLAEVLRQMKAEGLIEQYFKDAHSK